MDDSALVAMKADTPENQTREAQIDLLDQLIGEYRERIKELAKQPKELEEQLGRLEQSLAGYGEQLSATEADYRRLAARRRELRERLEEGQDRRAEIGSLLERFDLLAQHYGSDIERLRGIEEAGRHPVHGCRVIWIIALLDWQFIVVPSGAVVSASG